MYSPKNYAVMRGLVAVAAAVALFASTDVLAQPLIINFDYTQTDSQTGSGMFSGTFDGIIFTGDMPSAAVTQNDQSGLTVPAGMVGYMDGAANPSTNGNDFGVHLGWSGSVTLQGNDGTQAYQVNVPLVFSDGTFNGGVPGTPQADWAYSAEVTDDDGAGNDAYGDGFRVAGWLGEPTQGHRHSGSTESFVQGAVDAFTMGGTHGQVDENGWGDDLGIAISFRNGPTDADGAFLGGSGPVFVDSVSWQGGLTVDPATIQVVPEPSGLTLVVCMTAGIVLRLRRRSRRT